MRRPLRYAALILIVAVVLYPLVWMVGTSFKSQQEIVSNIGLIPEDFTPGNFTEGWRKFDIGFGRFFVNSAMVSVLTVVGNVVSCLLAAYALGRLRFRLRGVWFAVMIGTLLLPGHVLIIPQYILFRNLGWVGGDWPYLPLLVPQFLATEAFFVFLMVQFMRGIPRELDEAATIDGATRLQTIRLVVLPLLVPGIATAGIYIFITSWNEYLFAMMLSGQAVRTVTVAMQLFIGEFTIQWGLLTAGGTLIALPATILFLLVQRRLVSGLTAGAVKS